MNYPSSIFKSASSLVPALVCSLIVAQVPADTIHLKNGRTMEGLVTEQTPVHVKLNIGVGTVTLRKSQIASIEKSNEDDVRKEWQRKYFSHKDYAPPGLKDLARDFNGLQIQRNASAEAIAGLAKLQQGQADTMVSIEHMERERVDLFRRLQALSPEENLPAYNDLVNRNNNLQGRLVIEGDAIETSREQSKDLRRSIAVYQHALNDFGRRFREKQKEYRLKDSSKQVDIFFGEIQPRLESFEKEFSRLDIPFEKQSGHHVVTARINGKANVRLLMDTGATCVSFTDQLAYRLGLDVPDEPTVPVTMADGSRVDAQPVILDSIEVGEAKVQNVQSLVIPAKPQWSGIDGLLGMSFLREFEVSLDPVNDKLYFKKFSPDK